MPIIKLKKSIIPACDVSSLEKLDKLVKATCKVKGIGAYKIGFELVIPFGMEKVIKVIRKHTKLPIIYDHQKAGTDIPEMGEKFMKACKGFDAIIIFPQSGPETELAWIKAAQEIKISLIVGGEMTHAAYLEEQGGFIKDDAPEQRNKIAPLYSPGFAIRPSIFNAEYFFLNSSDTSTFRVMRIIERRRHGYYFKSYFHWVLAKLGNLKLVRSFLRWLDYRLMPKNKPTAPINKAHQ